MEEAILNLMSKQEYDVKFKFFDITKEVVKLRENVEDFVTMVEKEEKDN